MKGAQWSRHQSTYVSPPHSVTNLRRVVELPESYNRFSNNPFIAEFPLLRNEDPALLFESKFVQRNIEMFNDEFWQINSDFYSEREKFLDEGGNEEQFYRNWAGTRNVKYQSYQAKWLRSQIWLVTSQYGNLWHYLTGLLRSYMS